MRAPRFAFDQHVNARALKQLRNEGLDIVHVSEVGLGDADDAALLRWAAHESRIVVTRNYRDVAPLAEAWSRQGLPYSGILFYSSSVRYSDVGHHVRALREWVGHALPSEHDRVPNGVGWLR